MNKPQIVLLINTHLTSPTFNEGLLNASFHQKAKDFFENSDFKVLETKIEEGYNIDEEVEKHLQADVIILQTPVNWFGAPWIYKKYVDEVFSSAGISKKFLEDDGRTRKDPSRQYGTGGYLQGKKFMISATWNAPSEAFDNTAQLLMQGKNAADLLLPISSNYKFCGVEIMNQYNCFDIFKDGDIATYLKNYPIHLKQVFDI